MCYYFDDIIKAIDINFKDILIDKELYKEHYDISYKTSMGAKRLHIRYVQIDWFIKIQDRIKYLVLFDHGWFCEICDKIKYLTTEKSGITYSINHKFARIRIDSYNSLLIEKILTFNNVIIIM